MKKEPIALPADPSDAEDFDATAEALDRGQRARLIRTTRTALGLSQTEFAARFRVPVGTLRDWEQGRSQPDQTASTYLDVIARNPQLIMETLGTQPDHTAGK